MAELDAILSGEIACWARVSSDCDGSPHASVSRLYPVTEPSKLISAKERMSVFMGLACLEPGQELSPMGQNIVNLL
jgi:hypothetical protein